MITLCAFAQRTREFSDTRSSSSASSDADELEDIMHQEEGQQSLDENLNEPESSGLWDWDYKVPKISATHNQKETTASLLKLKHFAQQLNHVPFTTGTLLCGCAHRTFFNRIPSHKRKYYQN